MSTQDDTPITAPFCVFESGTVKIYINLCEIETVMGDGAAGSIVSMKSGADISVNEAPNQVIAAILLVSDTSAGADFRRGYAASDGG
jgi:hypothetical protein